MNMEQTLSLIRVTDRRGQLNNLADDFLFSFPGKHENGARYAIALLRLKRAAKGESVPVTEQIIDKAARFAKWYEENLR